MARKAADSLVIRGRAPLRALSAPQRVRILERLLAVAEPLSIRDVAIALKRPPAALYHHFVRKDRVLMRMLTG